MNKKILMVSAIFVMLSGQIAFARSYDACVSTSECDYIQDEISESPSSGSDQLLDYIRVTSPNGG